MTAEVKDILSFPFEFKANANTGIVEGYASIFGNIDSHKDIMVSGAFKGTLASEMKERVKVLWQHNPMYPIGKPIDMSEDSKGLHVKAKISETSLGKDAIVLMKDGVINEMSIGYSTTDSEYDSKTGIRYLKAVKLYEFSPVTWASNDQATISAMKSAFTGNSVNEVLLQKLDEMMEMLKNGTKGSFFVDPMSNPDVSGQITSEDIKGLSDLIGKEVLKIQVRKGLTV